MRELTSDAAVRPSVSAYNMAIELIVRRVSRAEGRSEWRPSPAQLLLSSCSLSWHMLGTVITRFARRRRQVATQQQRQAPAWCSAARSRSPNSRVNSRVCEAPTTLDSSMAGHFFSALAGAYQFGAVWAGGFTTKWREARSLAILPLPPREEAGRQLQLTSRTPPPAAPPRTRPPPKLPVSGRPLSGCERKARKGGLRGGAGAKEHRMHLSSCHSPLLYQLAF